MHSSTTAVVVGTFAIIVLFVRHSFSQASALKKLASKLALEYETVTCPDSLTVRVKLFVVSLHFSLSVLRSLFQKSCGLFRLSKQVIFITFLLILLSWMLASNMLIEARRVGYVGFGFCAFSLSNALTVLAESLLGPLLLSKLFWIFSDVNIFSSTSPRLMGSNPVVSLKVIADEFPLRHCVNQQCAKTSAFIEEFWLVIKSSDVRVHR